MDESIPANDRSLFIVEDDIKEEDGVSGVFAGLLRHRNHPHNAEEEEGMVLVDTFLHGNGQKSDPRQLEQYLQWHDEVGGEEEGSIIGGPGDPRRSFGSKSIGTYSSYVFIINQIFGPGVLALPIVFQQAGWVMTIVALIAFTLVSSFSSTLLCEAIRLIPGNHKFERRYEYASAVKYYFGKRIHVVFQLALCLCLLSLNIASIVIVAESFDNVFVFLFGKSFCLQLYPNAGFFAGDEAMVSTWYDSIQITITLGYVLAMLGAIPMGLANLDDNVKFQWISFIGLVVLVGDFIVSYLVKGEFHWEEVPPVGNQFAQLAGVCITSWAYVMLVPSWANEKKDHVSINRTIWFSAIGSCVSYIAVGLVLGLAFATLASDVILKEMTGSDNFILTRIAAYLFSLFIIFPGIPVFCITTRYNLFVAGLCGKKLSYFIGVFLPWIVGFVFSQGPIFASLLNWTSLLISGWVNFVLPLMLYLKATNFKLFDLKCLRWMCGYESTEEMHQYYDLLTSMPNRATAPETLFDDSSSDNEKRPLGVDDDDDGDNMLINPSGSINDNAFAMQDPLTWKGGNNNHNNHNNNNYTLPEFGEESLLSMSGSVLTLGEEEGPQEYQDHPLPRLLRPLGTVFVLALLFFITALILLQIGVDVFFLIAKGQSPI